MLRSQACPQCQRRLTQLITGPYCLACGYGSFGVQLVPSQPSESSKEPTGGRWQLWLLAFLFVVWCGAFVFVFLVANGAFSGAFAR